MNCLVWNCHGLGNLRTGKELVEIIWAKDPSVVFIAETRTNEARLDRVQWDIDFENRWVMEEEVVWYFSGNHQSTFLWRALWSISLISTSIKILRMLGVLWGFMVNQKQWSVMKPRMIFEVSSIIQIFPRFMQGILTKLQNKEKSWVELYEIIIRCNYSRK